MRLKRVYHVLLYVLLLFSFLVTPVAAQDNNPPETVRSTTNDFSFKQYYWQLVSNYTGEVICKVIVNHEEKPYPDEAIQTCGDFLRNFENPPGVSQQPTVEPSQTPPPINFNAVLANAKWILISTQNVSQTNKILIPEMIVNIFAPESPVKNPYLIIKASEPYSDYSITAIKGNLNDVPFDCADDECVVPLSSDSQIEYWAVSSFGDESKHQTATARLWISNELYSVQLTKYSNEVPYSDKCTDIWGIYAYGEKPAWQLLPDMPTELSTDHKLHILAANLINNKIVDASTCPNYGLFDSGAPNACGMDLAFNALVNWQNQFDPIIWSSGKEYGIPPIIIKSLIEQESQFWPENSHNIYYEYGLPQLNEMGADVALRWEDGLKNQICSSLLYDCNSYYASMNTSKQTLLRGGLIRTVNAECPDCEYQINLSVAEQSIPITAQVIRANCRQTAYIMITQNASAEIQDMWRFTMLSYHSGYYCLEEGIKRTKESNLPITWNNVSRNVPCSEGIVYINELWDKLDSFELNKTIPVVSEAGMLAQSPINSAPTVSPTATNTTNKETVSGKLYLFVYSDTNNNHTMDYFEMVSGQSLTATFSDGTETSTVLRNGQAIIPFNNIPGNSNVSITIDSTLPDQEITIAHGGETYLLIGY